MKQFKEIKYNKKSYLPGAHSNVHFCVNDAVITINRHQNNDDTIMLIEGRLENGLKQE